MPVAPWALLLGGWSPQLEINSKRVLVWEEGGVCRKRPCLHRARQPTLNQLGRSAASTGWRCTVAFMKLCASKQPVSRSPEPRPPARKRRYDDYGPGLDYVRAYTDVAETLEPLYGDVTAALGLPEKGVEHVVRRRPARRGDLRGPLLPPRALPLARRRPRVL